MRLVIRDVLLAWILGAVAVAVAVVVQGGGDVLWDTWWVVVLAASVVALSYAVRRWSSRRREAERRSRGLPPSRTYADLWRESPLKAAGLTVLLLVVVAGSVYFRTRD